MKVIVIGAGIGGLALANGLLTDGHDVQVLEAADALRTGGAAVTIFPNGHAALAGLNAPVSKLGGLIEQLEFRSAAGRRLFRTDLRPMTGRTGFPVTTVPRRDLLSHMAGRLPSAAIHFGAAATAVDLAGAGVRVTDAKGVTREADCVVGADGHASTIRRVTLDPKAAASVGWTTWQGLTPVLPEIAQQTQGVCLVGEAGLCGLMPAGSGLLQWWFDTRTPAAPVDQGRVLDLLRDRFGDYAEPVPQLLREVADDDVGEYPHVLHEIPDVWGRAATTLLGDAAHAFPPSQAQGANQALEDAWVLAQALREDGTVTDRLRRYEQRRVPRVRKISRLAASEITNLPPSGGRRIAARLVPPRLAGRGYLAMLRSYSNVLHDRSIRGNGGR